MTGSHNRDFGFDHWLATQNNVTYPVSRTFVRNGSAPRVEDFSCQIVVDEAINWLSVCDPIDLLSTQPFTSHTNLLLPLLTLLNPIKVYHVISRSTVLANVANVDAAVGKPLAGLKTDRRKNTLIVFTSDNGPETLKRYRGAERCMEPWAVEGMKLHTTDAGIRVAGIMNWPGKIAASGTSVSTPVSALDLFPTFCARQMQRFLRVLFLMGANFTPALEGRKIVREKPLIWIYYNAPIKRV